MEMKRNMSIILLLMVTVLRVGADGGQSVNARVWWNNIWFPEAEYGSGQTSNTGRTDGLNYSLAFTTPSRDEGDYIFQVSGGVYDDFRSTSFYGGGTKAEFLNRDPVRIDASALKRWTYRWGKNFSPHAGIHYIRTSRTQIPETMTGVTVGSGDVGFDAVGINLGCNGTWGLDGDQSNTFVILSASFLGGYLSEFSHDRNGRIGRGFAGFDGNFGIAYKISDRVVADLRYRGQGFVTSTKYAVHGPEGGFTYVF